MKKIILTMIMIFLLSSMAAPFDSGTRDDFLQTIKQSPQIQQEILTLAANTLYKFLEEGKILSPPSEGSWVMWERSGVFVTLEKYGKLRGCRGTLFPVCPTLAEEIINSSLGAATRDNRFPPLKPEELNKLLVTVTVVGEITPVSSPEEEINPLLHGIMVETLDGQKKGVMLPGEAPTLAKELEWAKKRASINQEEEIKIYRFTGVRFCEKISQIIKKAKS